MTMTGRAAFDVQHHTHGRGAASTHNAGNRADRRGLLREAMRDLDAGAADYFASQNPSIVREETHLNVSAVNDGTGSFRRPASIDEVLDYGDGRAAKVKRKIQPTQSTTSTFVVFLPRTMCEEIPRFYDGDPPRSRMVARDRDEAIQYFRDVVDFLGDEVLTGGQAAIHGYDINFDETTPHIQVLADNFGPDGKGNLRTDFSRIWTWHRDVTDDAGRVLSGPEKLRGYQAGLRERMRELGYDVELEASDRSAESLSKEEFALESDKARWRELEKNATARLAREIRQLEADQKKVVEDMAELPTLRQKAVKEGREAGYEEGLEEGRQAGREEGLADAQTERTDILTRARAAATFIAEEAEKEAAEKLATADREAQARIDAAARAIEAEKVRARQEAIPAYDPVAATDRMQADLVSVLGKMTVKGRPLLEVAHERAEERFQRSGAPGHSAETVAERRDRIREWMNESPPSAPDSPDGQYGS